MKIKIEEERRLRRLWGMWISPTVGCRGGEEKERPQKKSRTKEHKNGLNWAALGEVNFSKESQSYVQNIHFYPEKNRLIRSKREAVE